MCWVNRWSALLVLSVLLAGAMETWAFDNGPEPKPPVLQDPSYSSGSLTLLRQNVSVNATIYYNFRERGVRNGNHPRIVVETPLEKIRVDQDLGDGQIHTYLGDWQTSTSYFIVSRGNKVIGCMNFPNPDAVPSPGFFRHSEFKGRFQVNGALCQLWKAKLHDRPIDLYVKETDQSPVRLMFYNFQFDVLKFKAGFSADPTVWDIPAQCTTIRAESASWIWH